MNKILLSLLFTFISSFTLLAQDELLKFNFFEVKPLWEFISSDSTHIPNSNTVNDSKYSSVITNRSIRKDNDFYLLSACLNSEKSPSSSGVVVNKLDFKTGKEIWSHYDTPFNKGDDAFYDYFGLTKDGNIEFFGSTTIKNEEKVNKAIHKVIDKNNGKLLSKEISKDTFADNWWHNTWYHQYVLNKDSLYMTADQTGNYKEGTNNEELEYGVTFTTWDKKLNITNKKRVLFDLDSLYIFAIDQYPMVQRLNENTLVTMAYRNRTNINKVFKAQVMWMDISNPSDIKVKKYKNFEKIIKRSYESLITHTFRTFNNTIYWSHIYYNDSIKKYTAYVLWLDAEGNTKSYMPIAKLKDKNKNHNYESCTMFYTDGKYGYLVAFPSVTGRTGFDILKITEGSNDLEFVSSLTTTNQDMLLFSRLFDLYDDDMLVVRTTSRRKTGGLQSNRTYAFRASALGIGTKLISTKNEVATNHNIYLYPNPTRDIINISMTETNQPINMSCYDLQGRQILQTYLQNSTQINITDWTSGLYVCVFQDENGRIIKTEKIVKE